MECSRTELLVIRLPAFDSNARAGRDVGNWDRCWTYFGTTGKFRIWIWELTEILVTRADGSSARQSLSQVAFAEIRIALVAPKKPLT